MSKRKNFYAIYWIADYESFVVKDWTTCQNLCKGHPNVYRGFSTEEEAYDWLDNVGYIRCIEKKEVPDEYEWVYNKIDRWEKRRRYRHKRKKF